MFRQLLLSLLFLFSFATYAQISTFSAIGIEENLKENANSCIRNQSILVTILSQKSMTITTQKVVTVFNSNGNKNVDANEYFDKSTTVKSIEATIYNSFGKEIKKFKKKDFTDQSVADGFSVYNDQRRLFLSFTPTDYPYTIVYQSTVETRNTASIQAWYPIDDMQESVQNSEYKIVYPSNLGFKYLENNLENRNVTKLEGENFISYNVQNIAAEKQEDLAPSFDKILPNVIFGLENFSIEGYEGKASTWKEFGNWVYSSLLSGTEELPENTKNKILELTKNESDTLKKAKIVYQYVQDKTRYVSIQMGIGGYKPMKASDVDRLGYGDCKALSNYTRMLLKAIGITSYYTLIYGGNESRNIKKDFVSMQGNHAILALPINNKLVFLECTSQVAPFGFEGDFTDNRDALLVSENDSKIVSTSQWIDKSNAQFLKANCTIDAKGNLSSSIAIKSKGVQYDAIYPIERTPKEDVDGYYKKHFYWINNMKVDKANFINDREKVEFAENFQLVANGYSTNSNGMMMVNINVFNRNSFVPQRYRNRKNSLEIDRGFYDEDSVELNLPENFKLDSKPENTEINSKFGTYKMELSVLNDKKLLYKRQLLIKNGTYDKSEYDNYRNFREQVAKLDNAKIVLIAN